MPATPPQDAAVSGLERFTKTFWPYILVALGLIQYIYTQNSANNQSVIVEIRDEQKKQNTKLDALILQNALVGPDVERLKKNDEKQDARADGLEKRQNDIEKSLILSNGNRR